MDATKNPYYAIRRGTGSWTPSVFADLPERDRPTYTFTYLTGMDLADFQAEFTNAKGQVDRKRLSQAAYWICKRCITGHRNHRDADGAPIAFDDDAIGSYPTMLAIDLMNVILTANNPSKEETQAVKS